MQFIPPGTGPREMPVAVHVDTEPEDHDVTPPIPVPTPQRSPPPITSRVVANPDVMRTRSGRVVVKPLRYRD